jgi:hypothetical protein
MNLIKMPTHRFGLITAAIYASFLIYLPPFQRIPDLFREEFIAGYIKGFGFIFLGILSGVLLYYRPRIGRIVALILASVVILMRIAAFFPNVTDRLYALYVLTLQQKPLVVIHNDVILPLFLIFLLSTWEEINFMRSRRDR